jgi:hypothetical protein
MRVRGDAKLNANDVVDDWVIIKKLGAGGVGAVYLVRHAVDRAH